MASAEDLRRLALALPGVQAHPHFDRVAFKARVTFATLAPDGLSANFKFSADQQALKTTVAPDAFSRLPNAWGAKGWTLGRLEALSEADLADALKLAYGRASHRPTKRPK